MCDTRLAETRQSLCLSLALLIASPKSLHDPDVVIPHLM